MAITYKIIEKSNYEKDKKYNDFVESGVAKELKRYFQNLQLIRYGLFINQTITNRLNERDQKETESKANIHKKRRALDEENKILHEFKKQMDFINEITYRKESRGNQQFPIIREKPKLKTGFQFIIIT